MWPMKFLHTVESFIYLPVSRVNSLNKFFLQTSPKLAPLVRELVIPTVSVTTEDATMKRISDFSGAPQPKRPIPAARPEADITGPCSALPVDINQAVGNIKLTDRVLQCWTTPGLLQVIVCGCTQNSWTAAN